MTFSRPTGRLESVSSAYLAVRPPSTTKQVLVTNELQGEAGNTIASATSSGVPTRPSGWISAVSSQARGGSGRRRRLDSTIGVRMEPGQTALTRMPHGANSIARNLVSAMTAPYEVK